MSCLLREYFRFGSILNAGNDDTWSNNDLAGGEPGDPVHAPTQGQTTPSNHQGGFDRKLEVFSTFDPRHRHLWATDHVVYDCHSHETGKHHVGTKLRKLLRASRVIVRIILASFFLVRVFALVDWIADNTLQSSISYTKRIVIWGVSLGAKHYYNTTYC